MDGDARLKMQDARRKRQDRREKTGEGQVRRVSESRQIKIFFWGFFFLLGRHEVVQFSRY